jgi:transcriptional regulator with GAF, ATPase, and Fis domain
MTTMTVVELTNRSASRGGANGREVASRSELRTVVPLAVARDCSALDTRDDDAREPVPLARGADMVPVFEDIVGASPALETVLARIAKVAPTDATVLISGETGTGKELVARAIHRRSPRSERPMIGVNCAAIPAELIAAELFGHERGAFTGAWQRRLGRFELAAGGTLFLDEVGVLPMEAQIALLRALQEREFERVGGTQSIRADVRVVAATNGDLEAAIAAGTFRSDLYYRLNVVPIEIPPLRERREDIPYLVEFFVDRYARRAGKTVQSVSRRTLDRLTAYPWPGNIRELENVIERSVILSESGVLAIDECWLSGKATRPPPVRPVVVPRSVGMERHQRGRDESEGQTLEEIERRAILRALRSTRWVIGGPNGAAGVLGLKRTTLQCRMQKLGIVRNATAHSSAGRDDRCAPCDARPPAARS